MRNCCTVFLQVLVIEIMHINNLDITDQQSENETVPSCFIFIDVCSGKQVYGRLTNLMCVDLPSNIPLTASSITLNVRGQINLSCCC